MWRTLSLYLLIVIVTNVATKKVTISRCCNADESVELVTNDVFCIPNGKHDWKPAVFSYRKKTFLERMPTGWTIAEGRKPTCAVKTLVTHGDYLLLESGLLVYNDAKFNSDFFCIANNNYALVCVPDSSIPGTNATANVILTKCCGNKGVYNPAKTSCVVSNHSQPILPPSIAAHITLLSGFPKCRNVSSEYVIAGQLDKFEINATDGSLIYLDRPEQKLSAATFCIEHFIAHDDASAFIPTVLACPEDKNVLVAKLIEDNDLRLLLYPICLLVSVVFLVATLVTGLLLPSSHHVLHWRCQTNYVFCLMIGDLVLAISQLAGEDIRGSSVCKPMASAIHFFFLAAFFWLNTMCFNIWWTFRDIRPASLEKSQEACRLRLYEVYAWGGPLIIAGIALALDNLPLDPDSSFLRPGFGEKICWFNGTMEMLLYFFGPIGLLLAINLILFTLTARELTCGLWKREVVKSNTERAALGRVCMKLVVVMGVSWIADVISWLVGGPKEIWYITDLINTLQGLFIFIVIGCQPQVWNAVKRLWCMSSSVNSGATANGNHHSSSSHGLPSIGDSVTNQTMTNSTQISGKLNGIPLETVC